MKTINKVVQQAIVLAFALFAIGIPLQSMAQRGGGGHGGGGGGFHGGGGGGFHGGGGGFHGGGGGFHGGGGGFHGGGFHGNMGGFHGGGFHEGFHGGFHGDHFHGGHFHGYYRPGFGVGFYPAFYGGYGGYYGYPYYNDYYYDRGYYQPSAGYTTIEPGITQLPGNYETLNVGGVPYYFSGGAFYVNENGRFIQVAAPVGAIVYNLPAGAAQETLDGVAYIVYNNVLYSQITVNGQIAFQVLRTR